MNYEYKVTLAGIKGFFRTYRVNGANSLYTFHKQIQADLEFPADQPILFKALDGNGNVVARYALVDLGFGTVDAVSFASAIKAGAVSFIYFYDTKAKKSVIITLVKESAESTVTLSCLNPKAPFPRSSRTDMWHSKISRKNAGASPEKTEPQKMKTRISTTKKMMTKRTGKTRKTSSTMKTKRPANKPTSYSICLREDYSCAAAFPTFVS